MEKHCILPGLWLVRSDQQLLSSDVRDGTTSWLILNHGPNPVQDNNKHDEMQSLQTRQTAGQISVSLQPLDRKEQKKKKVQEELLILNWESPTYSYQLIDYTSFAVAQFFSDFIKNNSSFDISNGYHIS